MLYGVNTLSIQLVPLMRVLLYDVISPFYIFQFCSVTIWIVDEYYYFAGAIVLMSVGSILMNLVQTRRQQIAVKVSDRSVDCIEAENVRRAR